MGDAAAKARYYRRKQDAKNELSVAHPEIDKRLTSKQKAAVDECRESLERFCKLMLPEQFKLPWCDAHRAVIARIEAAVFRGESLAMALPRGSGKSTLCRAGCLWSMLFGHSKYVVLVCASQKKSENELKAIKSILRFSPILAKHFPKVVVPLRALENEPRRAIQQTYRDVPTTITWACDRIVFPAIKGATGAEACLEVAGIDSEVRGKSHVRTDGTVVRPDLCVIDDPQTAASAASASVTKQRLQVILSDCAYLAGPDSTIGIVLPMTVIRAGDLADTLLNREKHPTYHGVRIPYFKSMPGNLELWEEYAAVRRKCLVDDRPVDEANEFYLANREELDAGADPYWHERFNPKIGEVSTIQAGMHRWLDDRYSFAAEYQNAPERADDNPPIAMLSEAAIAAKFNGLNEFVLPADTSSLVAGIDVHGNGLYWCLTALKHDFTGSVVAYGVWPRQPSSMFRQANLAATLQGTYGGSEESAIVFGLVDLMEFLCSRGYDSIDGRQHSISRCLVDSGYQPESVAAAIQRSPHKTVLTMSKGLPLGPESKPLSEYDVKRMLRWGPADGIRWYTDKRLTHGQELLRYDKTFWVGTLHARLCTPAGDRSCIDLWGNQYTDHRNFASHMHGLAPEVKFGRGRSVIVWNTDRTRDDHWLDAFSYSLIAASMEGCQLPGRPTIEPEPCEPEVTLADLAAAARAGAR